jgi:hypothetical protein
MRYQSLNAIANAVHLVRQVVDSVAGNDIAVPQADDAVVDELIAAKIQVRLNKFTAV